MSRFQIQCTMVFMVLVSGGPAVAQVPAGQCDQATASCALSAQPTLAVAPVPNVRAPSQQVAITYDHKLLSVRAHGVSLRSVLELIGKRTGTEIDFGAGSDAGGIYVDLGPATVRDLLRELLNGSQLNYVMLRSGSDPGFVERLVILGTEHGPGSVDQPSSAVVATGQPAPPKLYGAGSAADAEEDGAILSVSASTEQPSSPPAVTAQPSGVQPSVDPSILKYQQQYQQALADAASSGKSREDILNELQKLQQKELDDQYSQSQPH
jgi:hypothetical protein